MEEIDSHNFQSGRREENDCHHEDIKIAIVRTNRSGESKFSEGLDLIKIKPTEAVTLSVALTSPLKKRVSIVGKIIQVNEPKEVKVKGHDIKIKSITVEDTSRKAKITLWRKLAESLVRPGDYVSITDVVSYVYNNVTTLQTTNLSTIEKCDAPVEKKVVVAEAIGIDDTNADIYIKTGEISTVSLELLQKALNLDKPEDVELYTSFTICMK
ncbi:hypothetical protein ACF0H5_015450 [Mactra antiquata]